MADTPGRVGGHVERELRGLIARSGVEAEPTLLFTGDPLETPAHAEIVQIVHGHVGTAIVGVPYWADSAPLAAAGIPTVLVGPRGGGEHETVEWVELASVERLCDVLAATARVFCNEPGDPVA